MQSFPILELLQDSADPPLTSERLEELRIELGVQFPEQYAEFLLQFNGGNFHRPVMLYVPNADRWTEGIRLDFFYGAPENRSIGQHLAWYAQTYEGRIPEGYLPIADCGGLDLILLMVADPTSEFGKVYFWDGTEEADGGNVHWLADSFNEFLWMLQYDTYCDYVECETDPLFQAIERGNLRAVEQFLAHGGEVNTRNAQGQTLLAAAAIYQWPKIVRLLLEHSADPNALDERGRTPLHHAATHSIDSVKLLLAAGADAKARDAVGKSVLGEWSYRADQILRAHGAEE